MRGGTVLDSLRAVAVLLVLVSHLMEVMAPRFGWNTHPLDWRMGRLGVLLFFVHTALVLMASMQRTPLTGAVLAKHFFIRRAFRIYPLAIATVAVMWLAAIPSAPLKPYEAPSPFVLASNFLLAQDILGTPVVLDPLWSLPLEIEMYVLLPPIFMAIAGGRRLGAAIGLWVLAALVGMVGQSLGTRLPLYGPCFMSGVLAYCLMSRVTPRISFMVWLGALIGLVGGYLVVTDALGTVHSSLTAWSVCLALGLILPLCRDTASSAVRQLAAVIAKYSYGIYLVHMPVLWLAFVRLADWPYAAQWAIFAALMVALPVAAYHWIEAPLIDVGTRVAARATDRKAPVPVAAVSV